MSESERKTCVERNPADEVRVVRRYEGEATAETLVLNLIRAHRRGA